MNTVSPSLPPAVHAFDAVAGRFDARFGEWRSVAAQRRAVRRELLRAFPVGSFLLELGGGTGEDALFLAARGRRVLVTDGAPAMLDRVREKARDADLSGSIETRPLVLEQVHELAADGVRFDGVFSNFAALNCVTDVRPVARALAAVLPHGARALLVLFGPFAPGEMLVQLLRGDVRAAFRRLQRGAVPARLGGFDFEVRYPRPRELARAFAPHFELLRTRGIGVFVPPSAAEPAISRVPRFLRVLETVDRAASRPLARLGDHILFEFRRTAAPVAAA